MEGDCRTTSVISTTPLSDKRTNSYLHPEVGILTWFDSIVFSLTILIVNFVLPIKL